VSKEARIEKLPLMRAEGRHENRQQEVSAISRGIKALAREQDADVVLFIYRDGVYDENTERRGIADILIAKHRHGPTSSVPLLFRKATASFVDAELRQIQVSAV